MCSRHQKQTKARPKAAAQSGSIGTRVANKYVGAVGSSTVLATTFVWVARQSVVWLCLAHLTLPPSLLMARYRLSVKVTSPKNLPNTTPTKIIITCGKRERSYSCNVASHVLIIIGLQWVKPALQHRKDTIRARPALLYCSIRNENSHPTQFQSTNVAAHKQI